jgi:hypothetical protein
VECLDNSNCSETQTCDLASHTCTPPDTGGCSTAAAGGSGPSLPLVALLLGASFLLIHRLRARRRLRAGGHFVAQIFVMPTIAATAFLSPTQARAATPRAGVQLGVGPRLITGKLAPQTRRGIGVSVAQEVRGRYIGGRVALGASYFITTQTAPPLSHELQLYSVAIGPQFYLPVGPLELALGADFRHVGIVSNSLVRLTGHEINYAAAGGTLQVRYQVAGFAIMLGGGYHPIFGLDSSLTSLNLAIGLATD